MNIDDLRRTYPEFADKSDDVILRVLQMENPGVPPEQLAKQYGVTPPAPPPAPRTIMGTAGDIGVSALKGAIDIGQAATGLADIVTGGRVGKALEGVGYRPGEAHSMLDEAYSDPQKAAFKRVDQAEGVVDTLGAAITNPSVVGHSVVRSLPSMFAGGMAGGALARAAGKSAALGGAVGEGAIMAGGAAEQIREQSPDRLLTGEQPALALATGVGGALLARVGAKIAKELKIADVDTMIAAGAANPVAGKHIARQMLEGFITEGALEELPQSILEQVLQNRALGKPLDEGVDHAAVLGLLAGGVMGAGAQGVARLSRPSAGPLERAADQGAAAPVNPAPGADLQEAVRAATAAAANPEIKTVGADPATITAPGFPAPKDEELTREQRDMLIYEEDAAHQPLRADYDDSGLDDLPQSPEAQDEANEFAAAAAQAAPDATAAQQEAGNAKAGHAKFYGRDVTIQRDAGQARRGKDEAGNEWERELTRPYGHFKRTKGADDANVDAFFGPRPDAPSVWIIDQPKKDGSFDEHKVMAGFGSRGAAINAYRSNYPKDFTLGRVTEMDVPQFLDWLDNADLKKPASPKGPLKQEGQDASAIPQAGADASRPGVPGDAGANVQEPAAADAGLGAGAVAIGNEPGAAPPAATPDARAPAADPAQPVGAVDAATTQPPRAEAAPAEGTGEAPAAGRTGEGAGAGAVEAAGAKPVTQERSPEPSPTEPDPQHAGSRWTIDRGAIPGEPFGYLDGDENSSSAAIVEVVHDGGRGSTYEVRGDGGRVIAAASTAQEAARLAEQRLDAEKKAAPADEDAPESRWTRMREAERRALLDQTKAKDRAKDGVAKRAWADLSPGWQSTIARLMGEPEAKKPESTPAPTAAPVPEATSAPTPAPTVAPAPTAGPKTDAATQDRVLSSLHFLVNNRANKDGKYTAPDPLRFNELVREAKSAGLEVSTQVGNSGIVVWTFEKPDGWAYSAYLQTNGKGVWLAHSPKPAATTAPEPAAAPKTDKAEIRPYRKPDGSIGYEAVPIVPAATAAPAPRFKAGDRVQWTDRLSGETVHGTFADHAATVADLPPMAWVTEDGQTNARSAHELADLQPSDKPAPGAAPTPSQRKDAAADATAQARDRLRALASRAAKAGAENLAERLNYLSNAQRRGGKSKDPSIRTGGGYIAPAHAKAIADRFDKYMERAQANPQDDFRDITLENVGGSVDKLRAKADLQNALADLGDLLGKNVRKNIVPEQEAKLVPILTRLLDAAFRLGYHSFKDAAKFALDQIREALGADTADALTLQHMQGAYIAMSGGKEGAEGILDVARVTDKATIEAHEARTADEDAAPSDTEGLAPEDTHVDTDVTPETLIGVNDHDTRGNAADDSEPLEDALPEGGQGDGQGGNAAAVPGSGQADAPGNERPEGDGAGRSDGVDGGSQPVLPSTPAEIRPVADGPLGHTEDRPAKLTGDNPGNFAITDDFGLGEGTDGAKIEANLQAIRTLRLLQKEKRLPTRAEQATMARYVGWGGLKTVFDPKKADATDQYGRAQRELKETLTPTEYREAAGSIRNAHYTAQGVVDAMWRVARFMGFKGGRALEPTVGIGNFIGREPADLAASTEWHASELDVVTGQMAALIYPEANILAATGFQDAPFADGAFDLAIGNPPFGSQPITDKSPQRKHLSGMKIHNYIIAKTGMHLRPGGVMSMVVTHRFLDTANPEARDQLAKDFRFLGAFRLPNDAFAANAGTEVTTDVVFLQKLRDDEPRERDASWLDVNGSIEVDGVSIRVNRYYQDHPSHILGRSALDGTMYAGRGEGTEYTVHGDGRDLGKSIDELMVSGFAHMRGILGEGHALAPAMLRQSDLPVGGVMLDGEGKIIRRELDDEAGNAVLTEITPETLWKDKAAAWQALAKAIEDVKKAAAAGTVTADDAGEVLALSKFLYNADGNRASSPSKAVAAVYDLVDALAKPEAFTWTHEETLVLVQTTLRRKRLGDGYAALRDMLDLRNRTLALIRAEQSDSPDMEDLRAELNTAYDAFVKAHGFLSDPKNASLLEGDVGAESGLEASFVPAISKAVSESSGQPRRPASAVKADILNRRVNFPYKEIDHADSPADALFASLTERGKVDLAYMAKITGKKVPEVIRALTEGENPQLFRDPESGDYQEAERYLSGNVRHKLEVARKQGMKANIKALEAVQPPPKTAENVRPNIRGQWMPVEIFQEFLQAIGYRDPKVHVLASQGMLTASGNLGALTDFGVQFRHPRKEPLEMFVAAASGKPITIWDKDGQGNTVKNETATKEVNALVERMGRVFGGDPKRKGDKGWAFADEDRTRRIVDAFNEKMNTHAPRTYDGTKYLKPVGASPSIDLRRTQKNAAWRMMQERTILLDHVVGAGKTFTIITGLMERRRMGLSRKPMVAVPNHLVTQWARDFYRLYPGAKVLAATPEDFARDKRRRLLARIATGDYDAVIVGHTSIGFMETPGDDIRDIIEEKLSGLREALAQARLNKESKRTLGQIEDRIARYEDKLKELGERTVDEIGIDFKALGVDYLAVDEAHEFKNLEYSTSGERVVGMNDPNGSKKAFDLYGKIRGLLNRGGAVGFATGTPVSNSLVEIYTVMSYLAHDELKLRNQEHFDAWSGAYAATETRLEYTATQKLKPRRVLAGLNNLSALRQLYEQFADIITMDDLKRIYREEKEEKNKRLAAEGKPTERVEFPVPKVMGGKRQLVPMDATQAQRDYTDYLVARMAAIEANKSDKNYPRIDNPLNVLTDARKASLDIRIVDPTMPRDEGGKVATAAKNIKDVYDKWMDDRGTQLVFCDLSTPAKAAVKDARKLISDTVLKLYGKEGAKREKSRLDGLSYQEQWKRLAARADELADDESLTEKKRDELAEYMGKLEDVEATMLTADIGFSVYDDLRALLVESGIPASEVAFIHDYNTPEDKEKLFDRVNNGYVRVLIGSSAKMGAGTNAQRRLVALHHMDAPWRPSDVEQREGRIIRQGNMFYERDPDGFEVDIRAYSTNNTSDTVMWQVLQRKAAGIEQFRQGNLDDLVEEGGDSDQYAEFMATSTGNPVFRLKLEAERELTEREAEIGGALIARSNAESFLSIYERDRASEVADRDAAGMLDASTASFDGESGTAEEFAAAMKAASDEYLEKYAAFVTKKAEAELALAKWEAEPESTRGKKPAMPTAPSHPSLMTKSVQEASGYARAMGKALRGAGVNRSVRVTLADGALTIEGEEFAGGKYWRVTATRGGRKFTVETSAADSADASTRLIHALTPEALDKFIDEKKRSTESAIARLAARKKEADRLAAIQVDTSRRDASRELVEWYKAQVAFAEVEADIRRSERPNRFILADHRRPLQQSTAARGESKRLEVEDETYTTTGVEARVGWLMGLQATRDSDGLPVVLLQHDKKKPDDPTVYSVLQQPKSLRGYQPSAATRARHGIDGAGNNADVVFSQSGKSAQDKARRQAMEWESRLFGGAYDASRLARMPKDAPMRKGIEQARASYNAARAAAGLEPVTDWSKAPAVRLADHLSGSVFRQTDTPAARRQVGELQAKADAIAAKWTAVKDPIVLSSIASPSVPAPIREEARARIAAGGNPPGAVLYEGRVYLFADRIGNDADLIASLHHEVEGHVGLRGAFGGALKDIVKMVAQARPGEVAALMKRRGMKPEQRMEAAEEILAEMAEKQPTLGFVRRAVAAVRNWLRGLGLKLELTDDDIIQAYLLPARQYALTGKKAGGAMAFAQGMRTVEVDGTRHPDSNSRGRVLHPTFQGQVNFWRWFRGSKVVDEQGRPRVVYHGTTMSVNPVEREDGHGIWFATDPSTASTYATARGEFAVQRGEQPEPQVQPVYLSLKNPMVVDAKGARYDEIEIGNTNWETDSLLIEARERGHDGLIVRNVRDLAGVVDDDDAIDTVYAVFLPEQIKSAIGNVGQYDPDSPGILFSQSPSAASRDFFGEAIGRVVEYGNTPGKVNWWHKTFGTPYDLAQRYPAFRAVYERVQAFLHDVSRYATEAADLAPTILPRLETWRDMAKSALGAEDTKAISAPIFEGTLTWTRDDKGRPVKMASVEAEAERMSVHDKAQRLFKGKHVPENVLHMWRGLPIEEYEAAVNTSYAKHVLKAGIVWSDAELKSMFGLNDAQVGYYREFRAAVDKSIRDLTISDMVRLAGQDAYVVREQMLEAKDVGEAGELLRDWLLSLAEAQPDRNKVLIDTAKRVMDKAERAEELMELGYAPLSRFGRYTVDVVDEDGERVFFSLFESRLDARRAAERMRKLFPKGTIRRGTTSDEEHKLFRGMSPETAELFGEMLGLEATGEGAGDVGFQEFLKRVKSQRSAMKRLIHRKGIAGFSEDVGRVLAGFVYSNARQTAQNLHTQDISRLVQEIPQGQGELKDQAVKLMQYVQEPQEEAAGIRGMLFAQYLGGSLAAMAVNMTQPFAITTPYLSQWGGIGAAVKQMKGALADVWKESTGDKALDKALLDAVEAGIVAPQEVHQLQAQARGKGTLKAGDGTAVGNALAGTSNLLEKVVLAWGKPFSYAELFNRRVTFIAAYRTAVAQGMKDPAAFAAKAVEDTQFTYNKGNKPVYGRGAVGSVLMTFKQYGISYIELVHRLWTQGGPEGRRAALYMLAMLVFMGGAGGLPFMEDASDLIDGLAQRLGYNLRIRHARQKLLKDAFGEHLGGFMDKGLSGIPGAPIDVAARFGMGNLIPGTGLLMKKSSYTRDVVEVAGPAGDLVRRGFEGANNLAAGNVRQAAFDVVPRAAANWAKAAEMATLGHYTDTRGRKVIDTDLADAAAKFVGFQPNAVARTQEAARETQQFIAVAKLKESEIADRWARAVFQGDTAAAQSARDEVRTWNANNPHSPIKIDRGQITKRVREMRKTKAQRMEATAPREIRAQVKRELEGK